MPFELGLDFACRFFGGIPLNQKKNLILKEQQYRYRTSLSDLVGNDIEAHGANMAKRCAK